MAKPKATRSEPEASSAKAWASGVADFPWKPVISVAVAGALLVGAVIGFFRMRQGVEATYLASKEAPAVAIMNRPAWMSDYLADEIGRWARPDGPRSPLDDRILKEAYDRLEKSAWVSKVRQVRRAYGVRPGDTLEVDCEFRTPIALVSWGGFYYLIDNDGFRLPERYPANRLNDIMFGRDGARRVVNIRVINGVKGGPPARAGTKWAGADLAAGLELVKALYDRPFAEEIWWVNVENFAGRVDPREAQIVLGTQYGTEVRWGEPVTTEFHAELSAAQKLKRLELLKAQHRRVDAGRKWVDIRMESVYGAPVNEPEGQARGG